MSLDIYSLICFWQYVGGGADDSVTDFHKHHPGGSTVIVANAGRDVTYVLFLLSHPFLNTSKIQGMEGRR